MRYTKQIEWNKVNTVVVSLHVNRNQDPELYKILRDAEAEGKSKSAVLRKLIEKGMKCNMGL